MGVPREVVREVQWEVVKGVQWVAEREVRCEAREEVLHRRRAGLEAAVVVVQVDGQDAWATWGGVRASSWAVRREVARKAEGQREEDHRREREDVQGAAKAVLPAVAKEVHQHVETGDVQGAARAGHRGEAQEDLQVPRLAAATMVARGARLRVVAVVEAVADLLPLVEPWLSRRPSCLEVAQEP